MNETVELSRKFLLVHIDDVESQEQFQCSAFQAAYCIPQLDFNVDLFLPLLPGMSGDEKNVDIEKQRDISAIKVIMNMLEKNLRIKPVKEEVVLPICALFSNLSRLNSGVRKHFKKIVLPPRKNFR